MTHMPARKVIEKKSPEPVVESLPSVEKKSDLLEKFVPVLILASIVLAFVVGMLWEKVSVLEKGSATGSTKANAGTADTQQTGGAQAITLDQVKTGFKNAMIKFGDDKRKVLFIEIADPSCPYCSIAAGKNPELNKQAGTQFTLESDGGKYKAPGVEIKKLVDSGKASFAYIYTPGHGNGELGTQALYCAFEKGKFWEVYDLVMSAKGYDLLNNTVKNDKTKIQTVVDFLAPAMNANDMKSCLTSEKYAKQLTTDTNTAQSLGVQGTPGFFINEKLFGGAYSFVDMQSTVDAALK
jgi:protein-disulfide isomerase